MSGSDRPRDFTFRLFHALENPGPSNWRTFEPFRRASPETETWWRVRVDFNPARYLDEWEAYQARVRAEQNEQEAIAISQEAVSMAPNTPAARRSSRLASTEATPAPPGAYGDAISGRTRRASATPGPSVVETSATRVRRGRIGATTTTSVSIAPLPPVQPTHSHAYGASGRANLGDPSRLQSANSPAGSALDAAHADAVARQDDTLTTTARKTRQSPAPVIPAIPEESERSAPTSRQASAVPSSRHTSEAPSSRLSSVVSDIPDGNTTNVDESRSFGLQHEAGLVPPHGFYIERPTRFQVFRRWMQHNFVALQERVEAKMPGPTTLVVLGLLLAYLLTLMFGIDIPQPDGTSFEQARQSLHDSFSNVAEVTSAGLHGLKSNAVRMADLDKQLADQRSRFDSLNGRYDSVSAELAKLKAILPELTVVRHKEDGDGYELLDHFWDALEERAAGKHSQGIKMPWDKWFNRNQEMVNEVQKSVTGDDYNAIMAWGLKHYSLITKDEVLKILQAHYEEYDTKYAKYDSKFNQVRDYTIEAATERYLAKHFKDSQHKLLEGAWAQKTIENARMSLEKPNFMSPKIGAGIDPYLTSPTAKRVYSRWQSWFYGKALTSFPPPNPPIEALRSWEEAGDCWCSAPNGAADDTTASGKAQLGVLLARAVYPTHLVIEHVPKSGTLDPGTAPRDVELWVQVSSPTVAEALQMQLAAASWFPSCGAREALPADYMCVCSTRYELDHWNHVQMTRLEVDFKALEVPVSKAVVRVKSTWGKARVCLYRVRLLGEPA